MAYHSNKEGDYLSLMLEIKISWEPHLAKQYTAKLRLFHDQS